MRALLSVLLFLVFLYTGPQLFAQKTIIMDDLFRDEYGQTIQFQQAMDAYKTGNYRLVDRGNDGNGKTIWQLAKIQQPGQVIISEQKATPFLENFTGTDMQGKIVESTQWSGKKVWLAFWSITTPASIDQLDQLEQAAAESGVKDSMIIIAVTLDARDKVQTFLKAHPRNLRIVPGAVKWYQALGIKVHPSSVLIINGQLSKVIPGLISNALLLKEW